MSSSKQAAGIGPGLTTVFSIACGLMVANLYYAQALIGEIAPALGLRGGIAGLLVTLTQPGTIAEL
ncbi:MAG: MFS transporter, partial [Lysobacteraceae bacterium]